MQQPEDLTRERGRDFLEPPATGGAAIMPEGRSGLLSFAVSTGGLGMGVVLGMGSLTPGTVPSETMTTYPASLFWLYFSL